MQEMQEVRLKKLSLRNFQGIKDFTLDAQTEDISVYGDNSTGKTTLANSFHYLLFGKNLEGRADFEVKTLDEQGQALHNLEHSVTAVFDMGGKELTLSRTLKEKWVKKRGSAAQTFSGHETDFKVNLVPVKKSEYEAAINSIIDEDTFRLLTNPAHFNALHWEKKRAILLTVCGDITDADVIASNAALSKLPEILSDYTLDDYRKILAEKRKKINQEIQMLPIRISEVSQGLPTIDDIKDAGELDKDLELLREQQGEKRNELTQVNAGGAVAVKTKTLREIEGELQTIFNEHYAGVNKQINSKTDDLSDHRTMILARKGDLATTVAAIEHLSSTIPGVESNMAMLRAKYQEVYEQELIYREQSVCPVCGQPLPKERLAEAKERALADFNGKKAQQLEDIQVEGKQLAARLEENKAEKARLEEIFAKDNVGLGEHEAVYSKLEAEIEAIRASATDVTFNTAYQVKLAEKTAIEAEIQTLRIGNGEAIKTIEHEIFELQQSIDAFESTKAKIEQRVKGTERIAELEKQEKLLAAEYEKLESELFLTEEFIRAKVSMLEEKINAKFRLVKFKLFNQLVNGSLEECCETAVGGVPYPSLNNAARINAGLEVINVLSEFYGFSAPIFCDNAEAVNELIPVNAQLIRLVVSKDPALRVEAAGQEAIAV